MDSFFQSLQMLFTFFLRISLSKSVVCEQFSLKLELMSRQVTIFSVRGSPTFSDSQRGYFHEKYCQKILILCKVVSDLKQKAYIKLNYYFSNHLINKLTN